MNVNVQAMVKAEERAGTPTELISYFDDRFFEISSQVPDEILSMVETELSKKFTQTDTDFLLRKRLHEVVKAAKGSGAEKIPTIRIYEGICTRQSFYEKIAKNPHRIAWFLQPIASYQEMLEESLYFALKKVRDELLTMPVTEKSAPAILKALEFFANRALGPVIQRIESKNLNMDITPSNSLADVGSITEKFNALKKSLTQSVINVGSKDPE